VGGRETKCSMGYKRKVWSKNKQLNPSYGVGKETIK
jgi:hypothetical protein